MQDFSGCRRLRGGAGRTRTNHQTIMGGGNVRPAHLVEHQALEARIVPLVMGISTKGGISGCARMRGGAGRTRTAFLNSLVAGSSATSSTTQSPTTGEILL